MITISLWQLRAIDPDGHRTVCQLLRAGDGPNHIAWETDSAAMIVFRSGAQVSLSRAAVRIDGMWLSDECAPSEAEEECMMAFGREVGRNFIAGIRSGLVTRRKRWASSILQHLAPRLRWYGPALIHKGSIMHPTCDTCGTHDAATTMTRIAFQAIVTHYTAEVNKDQEFRVIRRNNAIRMARIVGIPPYSDGDPFWLCGPCIKALLEDQ